MHAYIFSCHSVRSPSIAVYQFHCSYQYKVMFNYTIFSAMGAESHLITYCIVMCVCKNKISSVVFTLINSHLGIHTHSQCLQILRTVIPAFLEQSNITEIGKLNKPILFEINSSKNRTFCLLYGRKSVRYIKWTNSSESSNLARK